MNIIIGTNVDLISPFPQKEVRRIFDWNHCFRTIPDSDDTPDTPDTFQPYAEALTLAFPSWGVIDKHHLTNPKHEAPLVGIIFLEQAQGQRHGFVHFASGRRAFKMGLIEDALVTLVNELFSAQPELLRLGCYIDERNTPAKALFRRLNFRFEGSCADMTLKNGEPRAYAYFGLTKRVWESMQMCTDNEDGKVVEPVAPEDDVIGGVPELPLEVPAEEEEVGGAV